MTGDLFVYLMIALQGFAAAGYAIEGDWFKVIYFVGGVILTFGVLGMK